MYKRLKQKIVYWLASNLLPVVSDKELISFKKGIPYVNGVALTPGEIVNLRSEADVIEKMMLWQIINNDLNEKSQRKIYKEAIDVTDLLVGKTILFTLDVQKNFIDKMKSLKN
jgi:hypothetical protein